MKKLVAFLLTMITILFIGACNSGDGCPAYNIEGIASGINGDVVLQNKSNGDDLTVKADGNFVFGAELECGDKYDVSIVSQPPRQICTLADNKGTVNPQWVKSGNNKVKLVCHPQATGETYTVGGNVSGLDGYEKLESGLAATPVATGSPLVLQNNGGDDLTITKNGSFTFATALDDESDYAVTVKTQPSDKTCTITKAKGTIHGANVTDVNVSCVDNTVDKYTVGGKVEWHCYGSAHDCSTQIMLQNNGDDDLNVTKGDFTFSTPLPDGNDYNVTIKSHPAGTMCEIVDSNGAINGANVSNVIIHCSWET